MSAAIWNLDLELARLDLLGRKLEAVRDREVELSLYLIFSAIISMMR